ncbi:uncharacterized protein PV06_02075 [Exophiala oligosperma]|uniref:Uncharacterized protein n=1 Tax=Exophiala oligosperma TaxID=215243 RepID=A0A0D2DTG3_9EURO|nr:uncharacterized protein PV06_02075 [Exophiala oligosperma]KIW46403.1 hypothetical protein PV06_02075 [Exophiala oligosperma]
MTKITTPTTIAEILLGAGDRAREPYKLTALEFIAPRPTPANSIATWWWGLRFCFGRILCETKGKRAVSTFANSRAIPPRGNSFWSCLFRLFIAAGYFALHFAGWNFTLPTAVEQKLWRGAMIYFIGLYCTYLVVFAVMTLLSSWIARKYFHEEARTFIEVASMFPRWVILGGLVPIY